MIDQPKVGATDARARFKGDGWGWGYTIGLLREARDGVRDGVNL